MEPPIGATGLERREAARSLPKDGSLVCCRALIRLTPRTSDFHTDPIDTYQSMLEQAGPPYQGPVALNSDPTYINSIGLIEAYQTSWSGRIIKR